MANVACTRPTPTSRYCGRIAYVTYESAPPNMITPDPVQEQVRMCTTCRTQAGRENAAAKQRSKKASS